MEIITAAFDPEFVLLTILGYKLSLLEVLGVTTGLACVILAARERVSNWPVGIINNVFFFALFRSERLYPDMLLQVFFALVAVYGWYAWLRPASPGQTTTIKKLRITRLEKKHVMFWISVTALGTVLLGFLVSKLNSLVPALFPEPAAMPYADALIAAASVSATFLMARKRLECWGFWIGVDILATIVYASRGIFFLSAEYALFSLIAAGGLRSWARELRSYTLTPHYHCGLIIGKFMPVHAGHIALVEFAAQRCDSVTVLVGALKDEPIPGPLRHEWTKRALAHLPTVRVDYTDDALPTAATSSRTVSKAWARWLKPRYQDADVVVSSETYGAYLAGYMGIACMDFDPGRMQVPVSATKIRDNPIACWDYIAEPARAWFAMAVCLYGPESTGKTTMAERLAKRFQTSWVPEMARILIGEREPGRGDIDKIGPLHAQEIIKQRDRANRIFFVDSDLLTTRIYAERLFDYSPEFPSWVQEENRYDLYLLFYPDTPWVEDIQRSSGHERLEMFELFESRLAATGTPYVVIKGDWAERERSCIDELLRRWPELKQQEKET